MELDLAQFQCTFISGAQICIEKRIFSSNFGSVIIKYRLNR